MLNLFCVREKGLNVGNEVISLAVRGLLRAEFGDAMNVVPVAASAGEDGGWHAGLRSRAIHEMNLYGHGVVVGGGNLYENGRLEVDLPALQRLQPPLLLLSLSHGRVYDRRHQLIPRTDAMPDDVVSALNRRASTSVARDEATLTYLRDLGFPDAVLGGCPTLFLDELLTHHQSETTRSTAPSTLLSIRHPELMSIPIAEQARVQDEVRAIIGTLNAQGYGPVRLLCHDKRDLAFATSIGNADCILPDDVDDYLLLLRVAPLVVSFRLHASLPCFSFGTPVINISYDERSSSMMRTIGLEDWDIDFVRTPKVAEAVLERLARLDDLAALRSSAQPRWQVLREALHGSVAAFAHDVASYASTHP